jgi:hypothetical protein
MIDEEACQELLEAMGSSMSRGQLALEALVCYRAHALLPPEWALQEIESAYHDFKYGSPDAGWTRPAKGAEAPRTLGEAFGVDDIKGKHMSSRRERAIMEPIVLALFAAKKFPRTPAGFAAAADALFLSEKQVTSWVKGRKT